MTNMKQFLAATLAWGMQGYPDGIAGPVDRSSSNDCARKRRERKLTKNEKYILTRKYVRELNKH